MEQRGREGLVPVRHPGDEDCPAGKRGAPDQLFLSVDAEVGTEEDRNAMDRPLEHDRMIIGAGGAIGGVRVEHLPTRERVAELDVFERDVQFPGGLEDAVEGG